MTATCSVPDCDRPTAARSWCMPHYKRWWRNGDPLIGHRRAPDGATAAERLQYVGWTATAAGCWQWNGLTDPAGYGRVWDGTRVAAAHRLAYEVAHGPIPTGALIRHRCDNPPCVNPEHLLTGDDAANSGDMVERGRWAGRRTLKITAEQRAAIRADFTGRRGELAALAREYGVTPSYMHRVVKGPA